MEHSCSQTTPIGSDICCQILFLHAILGCDTTSQPHGIGKGNLLKKFRDFCNYAEVLNSPSAMAEEISATGEQLGLGYHLQW